MYLISKRKCDWIAAPTSRLIIIAIDCVEGVGGDVPASPLAWQVVGRLLSIRPVIDGTYRRAGGQANGRRSHTMPHTHTRIQHSAKLPRQPSIERAWGTRGMEKMYCERFPLVPRHGVNLSTKMPEFMNVALGGWSKPFEATLKARRNELLHSWTASGTGPKSSLQSPAPPLSLT